jgi:hypothetical protein
MMSGAASDATLGEFRPEGDSARRQVMSVTATMVTAEDEGVLAAPVPGGGSFVDPLVGRLHAAYGVDPRVIRHLATELLATFEGARVQAFVPILVEKRLREMCRALSAGPATGLAAAPGTPPGTAW